MKFSIKNFLLFLLLYAVIILVSNFATDFVYNSIGWRFYPSIIGGYYSYLKLPLPTVGKYVAVLPPEMLDKFDLKFNCLGLIINILFFASSLYLVFTEKIKLRTWIISFALLSLVIITYFTFSEIS
jgi:hypothetical protein